LVGPQGLPPRRAVRIGYFQVIGGASGDMLLGDLLDAGLSLKALKAELAKVPLSPYELTARPARQGTVQGARVTVKAPEEGRAHHLPELKDLVTRSSLSARVKERARAVLERLAQADDAGQALGAPVYQGYTPAAVEDAEAGVPGSNAKVAPAGQLQSARQAIAVDGSYRRLGKVRDVADAHRSILFGTGTAYQAARGLQVSPRSESQLPGTGDDEDIQGLVPAEGLHGLQEQPGGLPVHGIADLRAVNSDDEGTAPALRLNLGHRDTSSAT